jgi:hypothetical protein
VPICGTRCERPAAIRSVYETDRSTRGPAPPLAYRHPSKLFQDLDATRDTTSGGRPLPQASLCRMYAAGISLRPPNRSAPFSNSAERLSSPPGSQTFRA